MEPAEITFFTVLALGILWNMVQSHKEQARPHRLAIIEDNDDDFKLLKYFCEFGNNIVIDRYKTADNLLFKFFFKRPDAVIADFYLEGEVTGDKVIKLCDILRIDSILVTGNTQPIEDLPEERVLRKTPGLEHFERLTEWVNLKFA